MTKTLWILFIAGQFINAGNINWQQENGYYEINPIYGKHPSEQRVIITKVAETVALYGLTKAMPKHENKILVAANVIVWGFITYDAIHIGFGMRF